MAMLYMTDGRTKQLRPSNGEYWTDAELRELVGGQPSFASTVDGHFMVINDMGWLLGLDLNIPATRIYVYGRRDVIMGNALVVESKMELWPEEFSNEIHGENFHHAQ